MAKKSKGRPEKPKDSQRTDTLRIRLTEEEREDLNREAKRRGLETSTWARMILIETARPGVSRTGG